MFCLSIEIMVKKTMELHDFVFDNDIMRQKEGGSIGDVAKIYMAHWDKVFKSKVQQIGMELKLHKRYVDDINILAEDNTEEGMRDEEAMKLIQTEANSIHPSIQTTIDYKSNYNDKKLPMLDLKIWTAPNKDGVTKVMHEHYIKKCQRGV